MNSNARHPTRRAVLITIGGAAGFGLDGVYPADAEVGPVLPAGVYLPSRSDLGHALMSSARFHPVPPGCPTDYIRPRSGPFTPLSFSTEDFAIIRRLTELLLGEPLSSSSEDFTVQEVAEWIDLRVASASGVRDAARDLSPANRVLAIAYFGAAKVTELETENPEKICHEGLLWLSDAARARGSDQFLSLAEEQQVAILSTISDERSDRKAENAGVRFFMFAKAEIVLGYYSSQAGLKELDFKGNAFYARSPGCDSKPLQRT